MNEDNSSEGRSLKLDDSELLEAFAKAESPILKASEIANLDAITIGERQVRSRLDSLQDQERVGSRMVSANGPIRVWWDKQVEMRHAWPSQDSQDGETGVEVIDALDLPGRGEVLRRRREAIDAVFKYFFQVVEADERVAASKLRLVGWGADSDTYGSPESLWNNCLNKALDQSSLFVLYQSEKEWGLSEVGLELKKVSETALWENWEDNESELNEKYHSLIWASLFEPDTEAVLERPHKSSLAVVNKYQGIKFQLTLEMEKPIWNDPSGRLRFFVIIEDEPGELKRIYQNRGKLHSSLNFDIDIENNIGEEPSVFLIRDSFDFSPDIVFKQQYNDTVAEEFNQMKDWLAETRLQFSSVVEQLDTL